MPRIVIDAKGRGHNETTVWYGPRFTHKTFEKAWIFAKDAVKELKAVGFTINSILHYETDKKTQQPVEIDLKRKPKKKP